MTVAIQPGLENLANALRGYGFDVVDYENYPYPVDALVYVGSGIMQNISLCSTVHNPYGIFLVNAYGKSAEDIADILNRRTYTPLF